MRRLGLLFCFLLITSAGCIYYQTPGTVQTPSQNPVQSTQQSNTPPTIAAFTGVPATINAGSSSNLLWTVANASSVSIDQSIGIVPIAGTVAVSPATTTTYTLNAINAYGTSTATATITVNSTSVPTTVLPYPQSSPYPYPAQPPPNSANFAITNVIATVDSPSYSGPCPKTLTFTAFITSNGPGTATYGWERSDGSPGLHHGITFSSAGSQTVTETWQLGLTYTGWEQLHVFNPNDLISNQANFTLNCGYAVTGVTASVAPVLTGACPKTIAFSGLITANGGPMTVTYRWERSDGAVGPTQSLFFPASSSQPVNETWQLGASYSGWERLHVLAPNDMLSNQASFSLSCF
ncbi:MAG: hypothetical protein ABSG90_12600 [Dehalococcoidia bacterium]|jgi:hypothetical protein